MPIKITNKNQFLSHMGHMDAFTEEGILNIKQNMKAGTAVCYLEDNHKEQGPDYMSKFEGNEGVQPKKKFTLKEYSEKFRAGASSLKQMAISQIKNKDINVKSVEENNSSIDDKTTENISNKIV